MIRAGEVAKHNIARAVKSGTLSHALLITADEALCDDVFGYACSQLFNTPVDNAYASPDFKLYIGGDMKVDTVSEIIDEMSRPPLNEKRVIRIKEAGKMSVAVQNKLLKNLEEPLPNNHFFLSGSPDGLLPTVRSRCVVMSLGVLSLEDAVGYFLSERSSAARDDALKCVKMADGSVADAVLFYDNPALRELSLNAVRHICSLGTVSLFAQRDKLLDPKKGRSDYLLVFDTYERVLCDIQRFKSLGACRCFDYEPYESDIKAVAARLTLPQIVNILGLVSEAKRRISANVSPKQTLDSFIVETERIIGYGI